MERASQQGGGAGDGAALTFWGAAGTVTGSKFLLETGTRAAEEGGARAGGGRGARVLVDCGLFQGKKEWRERNWAAPEFLDGGLDAVVLTHAHLDHGGWLPRLVAQAADGGSVKGIPWRVYCTSATVDLLRVLLPDSAHIQEEDAEFANKKGFSKHEPALPLYTMADAYASLRLLRAREYDDPWEVAPGVQAELADAGHIIGSATARLTLPDGRSVLFSGDLGRYVNPLLRDPSPPQDADIVVMESTYGGRQHSTEPPEDVLAEAVHEAFRRGGMLLIPAFAVGRTQDVLYALRQLMLADRVPDVPIFVDSPLAIEATRLFLAHTEGHDPQLAQQRDALRWSAEGGVRFTETRRDSQALNDLKGPAIIIAGSGMATGGRILHHFKHRLSRSSTVVLLVGYQAEGTRGRLLMEGRPTLKIHGQQVPVHAHVRFVDGFSAHAGHDELLRWVGGLTRPPQRLFLVHGEPDSAAALAAAIKEQFGWDAEIPQYGERVEL